MSNIIIHNNEYKRIKTNIPQRKPRWMAEEKVLYFHSFSQTETRTKSQVLAEKKLSVLGWNFEYLEKKYKGSTLAIHVFDLSGYTLWMNKVLKDSYFPNVEDPIMSPNFIKFIEMNEKYPEIYKKLKNLIFEYPNTMETEGFTVTTFGSMYLKLIFVSFK